MADADGTNGGRAHLVSRLLGGVGVLSVIAVTGLIVNPLSNRVDKLEADMRRSDETLTKALNEHVNAHGHPGVLADVEKLTERITSAQSAILAESQARTLLDSNRQRELDHIWHEVETLLKEEQEARCAPERRGQ